MDFNPYAFVVSVDIEPEMLKQLKKRLGKNRLKKTQPVKTDLLSFLEKTSSSSIDGVASAMTIHNFSDEYREKLVREIFRALRAGGVFVNADKYYPKEKSLQKKLSEKHIKIVCGNYAKIGRADLADGWKAHFKEDERPGRVFVKEDFVKLLKKTGFKNITLKKIAGLHMVLIAKKSK